MYALREEDDILENQTGRWPRYFYPRPPRGGRHFAGGQLTIVGAFLSTPSVRRATITLSEFFAKAEDFYPRPPRGGRPPLTHRAETHPAISIHALREEGDGFTQELVCEELNFYPRPP